MEHSRSRVRPNIEAQRVQTKESAQNPVPVPYRSGCSFMRPAILFTVLFERTHFLPIAFQLAALRRVERLRSFAQAT